MNETYKNMLPEKISREVKETNKQVITQTAGLMSSAFMLVAALAWNEAIKAIINKYLATGSGIISLLVYAAIVTVIAVVMASRLNKLTEKYKNEGNQ